MPQVGGRAVAQQLVKVAERQAQVQDAARQAAAELAAERAQAAAEPDQEPGEGTAVDGAEVPGAGA